MWHMQAPTFNKWHKTKKKKKKKNKKVTLHILAHGAMRGCGLTSLVVCINGKVYDIRERECDNKDEIWTTDIRSLGFWDIREWVTLWRLILWNLGCMPILESMLRRRKDGNEIVMHKKKNVERNNCRTFFAKSKSWVTCEALGNSVQNCKHHSTHMMAYLHKRRKLVVYRLFGQVAWSAS